MGVTSTNFHAPMSDSRGLWSRRVYLVASTIAWWCALNALWLAFTLLGAVVLGVGPATVAACVLARRRTRGEAVGPRDFAVTWRAELVRGNVVILPIVALTAVALSNYAFFSALGSGATVPRLATLALLVLTIAAGAYVGPMYAYYDLPVRRYFFSAVRFALVRPASTVILLFVLAALAFATTAAPVLLVTVSVGAWLHTSTWLCVRFFEENEDRLATETENRLADEDRSRPVDVLRALPTQPLRIR
jgi:uncharacterized membrane protein YesL